MSRRLRYLLLPLIVLALFHTGLASVYNGHPKLVVIVVIDQFRGDLLERYHDQFGQDGFRLFLQRGAWFPDCNLEYANTRTGPGHATIGTGTYTIGHGILSNEWWNDTQKRLVPAVEDPATHMVGVESKDPGASPRNLMATTVGDELRLATQGRSRVFGVSLKDRAAILSTGFSANAAYWVDHKTGRWITSSYYMETLPAWAEEFNRGGTLEKYLRQVPASGGKPVTWDTIAPTAYANDFELEFARTLITNEGLGGKGATDLLVVSLSANDMAGHRAGPDTPEMRQMALALDRQLGTFFAFLDKQVGLANVWIALTADHGVAPAIPAATALKIPAQQVKPSDLKAQLNAAIGEKLGRPGNYVAALTFPILYLSAEAFGDTPESQAEQIAGDAMVQLGLRGYFTKDELSRREVRQGLIGRRYANSYSPYGGWYVLGVPAPFSVPSATGSDHALPYNYDTHVPLALFGTPFRPGTYAGASEPVDLAVTLAVLLGANRPSAATGRVLTEALRPEFVYGEQGTNRTPKVQRKP